MTHGEFLTLFFGLLGSSGFASVITVLLTRLFKRKDRKSAETKATMYNLLSNLQTEARRIVNLGYISRLEYNQFKDMYNTYKDLGGDGYADELFNQIEELNKITIQGGISA